MGSVRGLTVCEWECNSSEQARYSPVSLDGAATGFDCADPCCRSQIDIKTSNATEKNSLCQFWNDSNLNWLVRS
jgi:hypothetical protein